MITNGGGCSLQGVPAMPAPVPMPIRQAIWALHQQGVSSADLADRFALAPRTVRGLIRRRRDRGPGGLPPDTTHPARATPPAHPAREAALRLRREHPTWGAGLVRVWLGRSGVGRLPGARQIQRWFAAGGLNPAPRGRRPRPDRRRASAPHDTWQVDASERIPLAGGSEVSWLRVTDEYTGAVLLTAVFPPRVLEPSPRVGHPEGAAAGVRPVGDARTHPGRQRVPVGVPQGGPAERVGPVARRAEGRGPLERPPEAPAERGGRAEPGDGEAVGRARGLPRRDGVTIKDRCHG
jgi:hypothetical protein